MRQQLCSKHGFSEDQSLTLNFHTYNNQLALSYTSIDGVTRNFREVSSPLKRLGHFEKVKNNSMNIRNVKVKAEYAIVVAKGGS